MGTKDYRDLVAWQKAIDLATSVYAVTKKFPREEIYALSSQLRKAVVSIASNIAEGQGRRSKADFARFLGISQGSLNEVETQLHIANRLSYLDDSSLTELLKQTAEVGRLLGGLLNFLDRKATD